MATNDGPAEEEVPPEFECSICMKLLLDPVSVPCGHTFCRVCLDQSLGYRGQCAVCRAPVASGQGVNVLIRGIIAERYPIALKDRRDELQAELEATERLAEEARRREVAGSDVDVAAQGLGNTSGAPILPILRRVELYMPHCRTEVPLHTEEERQLIRYALQGGRRVGIIADPRGTAFDDAVRPLGVCAEVEGVDWHPASGEPPCVRLLGKFRFWLAEQPQEHEGGFELGRCEAFFDAPLPPQELVLQQSAGEGVGGDDGGAAATELPANGEENLRPLAPVSARSALELLEKQLVNIGHGGRHVFTGRFGDTPALRGGQTTSAQLEQISFWLLSAVISEDAYRRQWLASIDTRSRLEASRARLEAAGSRPVLDLPGARSWMNPAQSATTNLLLLVAIVILFVAKAYGLFDQRSQRQYQYHDNEESLGDGLAFLNFLR